MQGLEHGTTVIVAGGRLKYASGKILSVSGQEIIRAILTEMS